MKFAIFTIFIFNIAKIIWNKCRGIAFSGGSIAGVY